MKRLAEQDKTNSGWQRDLSVSYQKVGDVLVAQGKLQEALEAYQQTLAIMKRLAEQDKTNSGWQRDLG
jgi:predicted negative regulator of RcsB-dependent stress response